MAGEDTRVPRRMRKGLFSRKKSSQDEKTAAETAHSKHSSPTWNMGMLNDKQTIEVPGSVLLLAQGRNEPLGLRNAPARTSHSSLPTGMPEPLPYAPEDDKKKTKDGQIILEPQPDDSHNDPLNWASWRRDSALLSLGLYCMIGGGITPLIAAGFTNVAEDYHIEVSKVSLTTGLYMMGLGIGSVIFSPTAILYGKRPVYLFSAVIFVLASIWCALSPNFTSLIVARIFQGIAVSPVECLPSATIAEIFFLHERAFRIGIYTLLLLGGKNLIPLVSAAIIQRLSWRWVFWIVAMVVAISGVFLFLFAPETFWDRSPVPKARKPTKRPSFFSRRSSRNVLSHLSRHGDDHAAASNAAREGNAPELTAEDTALPPSPHHRQRNMHVGFAQSAEPEASSAIGPVPDDPIADSITSPSGPIGTLRQSHGSGAAAEAAKPVDSSLEPSVRSTPPRPILTSHRSNSSALVPRSSAAPTTVVPPTPDLRSLNSPYYERRSQDYFSGQGKSSRQNGGTEDPEIGTISPDTQSEKFSSRVATVGQQYTHALREAPPKSFSQQLRIYHGRLNNDKWWKAAIRPFILFSYPAILWSSAVYACSVGWLIVISESVAIIFRQGTYKFGALATGLVYLSPFIGGILGTAVAGKVSDIIVKAMARRNGGLYEPEFRLVMAAPITITTVIGLMGFGWSAHVDDPWIVPTVFFGIVSFGCSLGSTTAITFCVDSYRQYAGEALVTLNFSKNIFHGLVFSLFVTDWLTHDGSKTVFVWIGVIQLIVLFSTIPMYIFGKRARMWTVRKNLMEKF
ncbi:MFS general substrate transporter [Xylariales sp. AK1849]|nr:MFS general substrate transporter [Xylariales sp. AK1849]